MVRHVSHNPPFALGSISSLYMMRRRGCSIHLEKRRIDGRSGIPALAFPRGGRGAAGAAVGIGALAAGLDASCLRGRKREGCPRWLNGRRRQAAEAKQGRTHAPEGEHACVLVMVCVVICCGRVFCVKEECGLNHLIAAEGRLQRGSNRQTLTLTLYTL